MKRMRPYWKTTLLLPVLLLLTSAGAAAQPLISAINSTELPRSGRVAIEGYGFGFGGEVSIAGINAWTTTWTDTRVVAYVPEAAPLGPASLYLVSLGQQSNEVSLTVTERQPDGRIRWTFEADTDNLWWRPAVAPDGTIYLHGSGGFIYALSPDGGLLWTQQVATWPYVPPTAGPDGALYVGNLNSIYRLSPQGQIQWQLFDPGAQDIQVAPMVGPDGGLYGAFELGIGAFAVDAATGQLLWSNPGDPIMSDWGSLGTEMRFGPAGPGEPFDQLYVHMDGGAGFYAFSLDGSQLFTRGDAVTTAHEPAVGADGTIYMPALIELWVRAIDAATGSILWEYDGGWASGISQIEIGPDDTLYFVGDRTYLEAFDPRTQSSLWRQSTGDLFDRPTVSPDGSTLIVNGVSAFGEQGFVKGFSTARGQEQWTVYLPMTLFPSFRAIGTHHPRITADSSTAYVSTFTIADWPLSTDPHSFLVAIDIAGTGGGGGGVPDTGLCNNDGVCSGAEDCNVCPNDCPGKINGKPANRWCCGDGVCSGPEDTLLCAADCGAPPLCGDGLCDPLEDACLCSADCGPPPADEVPGQTCADGRDNDCDGFADCDDGDCATAGECLCLPKNASCSSGQECCSGTCKANGRCR